MCCLHIHSIDPAGYSGDEGGRQAAARHPAGAGIRVSKRCEEQCSYDGVDCIWPPITGFNNDRARLRGL